MENVGRLGKDLERGKVGGREGKWEEERGRRRRKRGEGGGGREGRKEEEERGGRRKREEVVGRGREHTTYYTVPAVGCRLSW